jgi:hypothetical protein
MTTLAQRAPEAPNRPTMPISDIVIGDHYRHGLGRLRDLQQSIRKEGLHRPVPVTPDGLLIVGGRRLLACRNLGWTDIPVHVVHDTDELIDAVRADLTHNSYVKSMAASELVALGLRIEEIERPMADERRGGSGPHKPAKERRQSRDVAAEAVGMPRHLYVHARAIALAASGWQTVPGGWSRSPVEPSWQEYSRDTLDLIDRVHGGERILTQMPGGRRLKASINSIYEQWNAERIRRYPPTPVRDDSYVTSVVPRAGQRKALASALQNLTGLCHGLASIDDIDPSITKQEAALFERDLSNAARMLRNLNTKIKEYANGIA